MSDAKNTILSAIRRSMQMKNSHVDPKLAPENVHFLDGIVLQNENLLENFIALQKANMGEVVISSRGNLHKDVARALLDHGAQNSLHTMDLPFDVRESEEILRQKNALFRLIPYEDSVEKMRNELFKIEASVVLATCGVANLGIMGLVSSPKSPRLASLITPYCIMLLDKSKIFRNMFQALTFMKTQNPISQALPTNMFFVAGPSRTADIELKTVFGVHGPQKTTTILF